MKPSDDQAIDTILDYTELRLQTLVLALISDAQKHVPHAAKAAFLTSIQACAGKLSALHRHYVEKVPDKKIQERLSNIALEFELQAYKDGKKNLKDMGIDIQNWMP